jgi:ketosteroid isomerase-like protein
MISNNLEVQIAMTSEEQANLETVRTYLAAIESGEADALLSSIFTEDIRQIELPNRLNPSGQQSDLAGMLQRNERGRKVLRSQHYEIVSEVAQGSRVAVEAVWTGILSVPLGTLRPGSEMKAYFAMFFEFRDGRIASQRNYDCFEAW